MCFFKIGLIFSFFACICGLFFSLYELFIEIKVEYLSKKNKKDKK
jgi:hypothetical protein